MGGGCEPASPVATGRRSRPGPTREIRLPGLVTSENCAAEHAAAVRSLDEIALVNGGAVLEQAVGQALRGLEPRFMEPALFYWAREQKGTETMDNQHPHC